MSDQNETLPENLLRDIYAVSDFGTLVGMLGDIRESKESQKQLTRRKKACSSRRRVAPLRAGRVVILPDDNSPVESDDRGAMFNWPREQFNDANYAEITRDLQEISSGTFRNETIEAHCQDTYWRKKLEKSLLSDYDEDAKSFITAASSIEEPASTAERQTKSSSCPLEVVPAAEPTPSVPKKQQRPKKPRNSVLLSCLAKANKQCSDEATTSDGVAADAAAESTRCVRVKEETNDVLAVGDAGEDDIFFRCVSDSTASSEAELEGRQYYTLDHLSSDDQAQSTSLPSLSSSPAPSLSLFDLTSTSNSSGHNRGKTYHSTSRRYRIVGKPSSATPTHGTSSSSEQEYYVPDIVPTSFVYDSKNFPAL